MSDDGDRRNRPWRPGLDLAEYVDGLMEKHKPRPKYKKLQAYKAKLAKQEKKGRWMNCYNCGRELIPGGDHEVDEKDSKFLMVTNLSCPGCGTLVEVYTPKGTLPVNVDKHAQNDKNV